MNSSSDVELVSKFADAGLEGAFSELVDRYAALVYTVGCRVTGSPDMACDVTQMVFVDLLRKIPQLRLLLEREPAPESARALLSGWFHRAARYEALELIRSETRRKTRERVAMEGSTQNSETEPAWHSVRPLLDEALDSLEETDRRAVLLRYFQGAGFREIGAAFGISDDAAQKRVSRAVDRLREAFMQKGVVTSAAALAASLASHALEAMPAGLASGVAKAAWQAGAASAAVTAAGAGNVSFLRAGFALAGVAATVLVLLFLYSSNHSAISVLPASDSVIKIQAELPETAATPLPNSQISSIEEKSASSATSTNELALSVISAGTGHPISGIPVRVTMWFDENRDFSGEHPLTDVQGHAQVQYTNDLLMMRIELSMDGFADTRLEWKPRQGQRIPPEYTARLTRSSRIGGFVIDQDGAPLTNTWVQFSLPDRFDGPIGQVESFFCLHNPKVVTDESGYWETSHLAREVLPRLEGAPWRTDFLSHGWLKFSTRSNAIEHLLARTFVFQLERGLEVHGTIVDQQNQPASGVRITLGSYHSNQRSSTSSISGEIVLKGCVPGQQIVTAHDSQRGVTFQIIDVSTNTEPFALKLQPFRTLHVRTVDSDGTPVAGVEVAWQSVDANGKTFLDAPGKPTAQFSFSARTDLNGELIWQEAPADSVLVSFYPKKHSQLHNLLLNADGSPQTVTLQENFPPQTIRGTVRDGATGALITQLRVRRGYPRTRAGVMTPVWYDSFRDVVDFAGGTFKFEFEYTVDEGPSRYEYIFEISADGYETAVSRLIRGDEGNVDLEFFLQSANQISKFEATTASK